MAFITGSHTLGTTCFTTQTSVHTKSTCATTTNKYTPRMSSGPLSRRDAMLAGAALLTGAILPKSAFAKSGDSPKISIFGVGGASSPFDAGIQTGGKVIYKSFNDDEIAVFKRIFEESKERIEGASESIKIKSWEDIRSRLRLGYDLRKIQIQVNANIENEKQSAAATKAYKAFKQELENLDQACIQKNQDKAYKAYNASLKTLATWQSTAGF